MILVAGCNGHVGREIVKKAAEKKIKARCFDMTPCDTTGLDAALLEVVTGDITSLEMVQSAVQGVDTVIFVIGRKRGTRNLTHEMVEHGGMQNIIQAGKQAGVKHILYISALGVDKDVPATSLAAKWKTEQTLIQSGIPYTIFRPSGYFVDFAEEFAPKIRQTGSFTIIGEGTCLVQPLAPADLAEAFIQSLDNPKTRNKIIKIAGPETFTLIDIIRLVGRVVGRDARIKKIPRWLGSLMFSFLALLTGNPGAKDFLYRMSRDSVCSEQEMQDVLKVFSIEFRRLEPWLREAVTAH